MHELLIEKILEPRLFLELNAKLQTKKNAVRKDLADMGMQEKGKQNKFDNYKYFSEAQYKNLFTNLFSKHGLELTSSECEIEEIAGTEKQPFARRVSILFTLTDIDTGFYETSKFSGEGMDKGDKSVYKASTGALKYYFADTFNVATGDESEIESPEGKRTPAKKRVNDAEPQVEDTQIDKAHADALIALAKVKRVPIMQICERYHVASVEVLAYSQFMHAKELLEKMPDKATNVGLE